MKTLNIHIRGLTALLCHSDRGSDPLDPIKKEQAEITAKRKKTEQDHKDISRLDWYLGIYRHGETAVVPTWNLFAAIRDGAKLSKRGRDISRAVIFEQDSVPILYDGPKTIDALFASGKFQYRCAVGNQKARVIRTRPMFNAWELKFKILYDETVFNHDTLVSIIEATGKYVGLGDFRPRFGRFEIISTS